MYDDISLSLVIMAWNEEQSLPRTLAGAVSWLERSVGDWEIVVVDDGSADGTADVVRAAAEKEPRIRLCQHPENRGMGAAIRTGYAATRKDWVTQMPADGQVPPETFDLFLPYLPEVDIVLSVYDRRGDGLVRTILSRGYSTLGAILFGRRADYTGTMVFRRSLLDGLALRSDSFLVNLEFPMRALERGAKSALVTFRPAPRLAGQSKVARPGRILWVASEMVRLRFSWNRRS